MSNKSNIEVPFEQGAVSITSESYYEESSEEEITSTCTISEDPSN